MNSQPYVDIRKKIIERLMIELVGPEDPYEKLPDLPSNRYLAGVIWPINQKIDQSEDEPMETAESDAENNNVPDTTAPIMHAMKPSSIGLSFSVKSDISQITVSIDWGTYEKQHDIWARQPYQDTIQIDLCNSNDRNSKLLKKDENIYIEWIYRRTPDATLVSLFLVNRKPKPDGEPADSSCLFQPQLTVTCNEEKYPFVAKTIQRPESIYEPSDVMKDHLLYRHRLNFASGHGVSATWDYVSPDAQAVGVIKTSILPVYELPQVLPPQWEGSGSMDMIELASCNTGKELVELLQPLVDSYKDWIDNELQEELQSVDPYLKQTAGEHVDNCKISCNRMYEGLDLIYNDTQVFEAFTFACRAMAIQRTRESIMEKARNGSRSYLDAVEVGTSFWRPFQIAFILQTITSIVKPLHNDRMIADLLWFPTGGGKTEAYLGLTAFTLALRRLRRKEYDEYSTEDGVTVIMRYTLRLLTTQQFERACSLICACELLRRENISKWGEIPFRIGLWVGNKNTPETFDDAKESLNELRKSVKEDSPSKLQLTKCPFCSTPLKLKNYLVIEGQRRILLSCSDRHCPFNRRKNEEGLPVLLTDEEIYRFVPSFLIGTVDKFARLPMVENSKALFGRVSSWQKGWGYIVEGEDKKTAQIRTNRFNNDSLQQCKALLPPELIIQDELHLISGPLGTMVGIFETGIDAMCSYKINNNNVFPKIVASTATIRRADDQIRSLFNRRTAIFPAPGLKSGYSFFSREQSPDVLPGRIYVGIYAPGKSMKTVFLRTAAALLSAPESEDFSDEIRDPYRTLVSYFNSMRELGGAIRLFEDDIPARINVLEKRNAKYKWKNRKVLSPSVELTSRLNQEELPDILDRLNRTFFDYESQKTGPVPVDVVLATNMMSVGVDIQRLGLMIVNGQPKTTSEYIQASSRVGRQFPGLIITLYNWARPRDLSHYEQFHGYHQALYRYVESISVTPFSSRARDRGFPALLVMMNRHLNNSLTANQNAGNYDPNDSLEQEINKLIIKRAEMIDGFERSDEVKQHLSVLSDIWFNYGHGKKIHYRRSKYKSLTYCLGYKSDSPFGISNSMRNVEPSMGLYLLKESDHHE